MNILLNKGAIIERCLRRIRQEHEACPNLDDFTHLDALILNLERACQAAIDMAMHEVARRHLGMPQELPRLLSCWLRQARWTGSSPLRCGAWWVSATLLCTNTSSWISRYCRVF